MNGQEAGRLTRASLVVLGFSPDLELKVSLGLQQGTDHVTHLGPLDCCPQHPPSWRERNDALIWNLKCMSDTCVLGKVTCSLQFESLLRKDEMVKRDNLYNALVYGIRSP